MCLKLPAASPDSPARQLLVHTCSLLAPVLTPNPNARTNTPFDVNSSTRRLPVSATYTSPVVSFTATPEPPVSSPPFPPTSNTGAANSSCPAPWPGSPIFTLEKTWFLAAWAAGVASRRETHKTPKASFNRATQLAGWLPGACLLAGHCVPELPCCYSA